MHCESQMAAVDSTTRKCSFFCCYACLLFLLMEISRLLIYQVKFTFLNFNVFYDNMAVYIIYIICGLLVPITFVANAAFVSINYVILLESIPSLV